MLAVRHCVETLVSKALKCRRAAPEYSLLLGLCIHEQLAEGCRKFVEECLAELFALGEYFDLTTLMSFSTLLSFMVNNWAV